jgi:hypothetical protein
MAAGPSIDVPGGWGSSGPTRGWICCGPCSYVRCGADGRGGGRALDAASEARSAGTPPLAHQANIDHHVSGRNSHAGGALPVPVDSAICFAR